MLEQVLKTIEGRKQSAPVYFDGADNAEPTEIADPPPCAYLFDKPPGEQLVRTMKLLGVTCLDELAPRHVTLLGRHPARPRRDESS